MLGPRKIFFPYWVEVGHKSIRRGEEETWRIRSFLELHICLLWSTIPLARVATNATSNYIGPGSYTTAASWENMVEGKVISSSATVLTGEVVSPKDIFPVESNTMFDWPSHVSFKPNDTRDQKHCLW